MPRVQFRPKVLKCNQNCRNRMHTRSSDHGTANGDYYYCRYYCRYYVCASTGPTQKHYYSHKNKTKNVAYKNMPFT